ncbi:ead/Ea22-like family protein [Citrobacter freundii]|uniref:ead/Ea22-like family protein n=1 Tax=Citrobacter freundii TaxID=546 RepID=UPI00191B8395|nr:ead/Ea22-like family protein [Citrobacter freundii]MDO3420705.1 ead/Ea22-like family protein [Citrobacter freundii]QSB88304.1 ead/Ea22-like family protein [Citrobacter freundii]CAE6211301.1 hypothetical protein AI2642V1_1225 [Citrobacter freundii]CAH3401523.1 hypothetical protein AI2642V1_1225 [Citrobacter freundii]
MSNIDKRALRKAAMHAKTEDDWGCDADNFHDKATPDAVLALLDELEAAEKRIAELDSEQNVLRPVGVMSEKAFHRLENSESRFIALWPRPEIYLPRERPNDCVIVYARIANAGIGVKGE